MRSSHTHHKRWQPLAFLVAVPLLALSSCYQPTTVVTTVTPVPSMNLTPANQAEATLFPAIATHTALVGEMQQTLVPMRETLMPMMNTATAAAGGPAASSLLPGLTNSLIYGWSFWFLLWFAPLILFFGFGYRYSGYDLHPFILFFSYPEQLLSTLAEGEIDVDQLEPSGFKRLLVLLNHWTAVPQSRFYLTVLTVTVMFLISQALTWPSIQYIRGFSAPQYVSLAVYLFLMSFLIAALLVFLGKILGMSFFASLAVPSRDQYNEKFLADLWVKILVAWAVGLPCILLTLLWPGPLALPRTLIVLIALTYLALVGRQAIRALGLPRPNFFLFFILAPFHLIYRKIVSFIQTTYLFNATTTVPVFERGKFKLYTASLAVFLWMSLSSDSLWHFLLGPWIDSQSWLIRVLEGIHENYLPMQLETLAGSTQFSLQIEWLPTASAWINLIFERPGIFSALLVLGAAWCVEFVFWALSSTAVALHTDLRRFNVSKQVFQAAWLLVATLAGIFIWRAIIWSAIALSPAQFMLPFADRVLTFLLLFWICGWLVFTFRFWRLYLPVQRYYLLPVALAEGTLFGPIAGNLGGIIAAFIIVVWFIGNFASIGSMADPYLPEQLVTITDHLSDTQSMLFGTSSPLENLVLLLILFYSFVVASLYGGYGIYLKVQESFDESKSALFFKGVEIQFTSLGTALVIWGLFSAALILILDIGRTSQVIGWPAWLYPSASVIILLCAYLGFLRQQQDAKKFGGASLFVSIWFWPFLYWRPLRGTLGEVRQGLVVYVGRIWTLFKFLYLPYPYRANQWFQIVQDTSFTRGVFEGSSIKLPYRFRFHWSHMAGAGFAAGQALVYFVTDTLFSIIIWPWLPGVANRLTGTSLIKDGLIVDPSSDFGPAFNALISQALILFACVIWSMAFVWFVRVLQKGPPLSLRKTKATVYRLAGTLLLSVSVVHLFYIPVHKTLYAWLQNSNSLSSPRAESFAAVLTGLVGLTTLVVFILLSRTTLRPQFGPILQGLREGMPGRHVNRSRSFGFFRLVRDFLSPAGHSAAGQEHSFFVSRVIWVGFILQLIGFGLGWIVWSYGIMAGGQIEGSSYLTLAQAWSTRIVILLVGSLFIAGLSVPLIYQQSYRVFAFIYRAFAYPVAFLESPAGQLPAVPRLALRWLNLTFTPRHLVYPGYRQLLQSTLLVIWFMNGLVGLASRPLEAFYAHGSLANSPVSWVWLEMLSTIVLAAYVTANLARVLPVVMMLGGAAVTFLMIRFGGFLPIVTIIVAIVTLYGIAITTSTNRVDSLYSLVRGAWQFILSRFDSIETKWFVLELFLDLDELVRLGFPKDAGEFERGLMPPLQTYSSSGLDTRIRSNLYEEDPLVQILRAYFHFDGRAANDFVNSLLLTSQALPSLNGVTPQVRRWIFEAAIRVRFIEMEKTSENYLASLMQLRAARLMDEVRETFSEPPVWQPLPLPVALTGVSTARADRHAGEAVLPREILNVIRVYTSHEIDIQKIMEAWERLVPSPIAEEVLKAVVTLNTLLSSRSLTDIAALTFSGHNVFSANYSYMIDLNAPIVILTEAAETIARAEELATQDRPQFYVSALQQLQRLQPMIDADVRSPEQVLFRQSVFLWNTFLTEALSSTIIPRSRIEIEIEQLEREWEQEEVIVLVISNHAQGTAYNLRVQVRPGEGYEVIEPNEEVKIEMLPGNQDAKIEFRLRIDIKEDVWVNILLTYDDAGQPNHVVEDKKLVQYVREQYQDKYDLAPLNFDKVRNPYHYGLPIIDPGQFFGRSDIMSKIRQIISATSQTNIVMLYGQRRMGKSTILRQLLQKTREENEFWPVFIDVEVFTRPGTVGFLWELAHEIWRALPGDCAVPEPTLEEFQISPGLHLIKNWMPLVDSVIASHGRTLLLLLDEFDLIYQNPRYQGQELSEIMGVIRGLAHERHKGGIIYVGTYRLLEMTRLYQTPLFNQAVPIRVSFLDDNATKLLIRQPAQGILKYDANAVSKIMRLTGNHPYYLQLICASIFEQAMNLQVRTVNVSRVINALEQAQQQGGLILDYLWKENTPLQKYVIGALARLNEHETSRASISRIQRELSAFLIDVSSDEVQKSIEALSQWEIILNENGQYRFSVDLFRLWLREHKTLASIRAEVGPLDQKST